MDEVCNLIKIRTSSLKLLQRLTELTNVHNIVFIFQNPPHGTMHSWRQGKSPLRKRQMDLLKGSIHLNDNFDPSKKKKTVFLPLQFFPENCVVRILRRLGMTWKLERTILAFDFIFQGIFTQRFLEAALLLFWLRTL